MTESIIQMKKSRTHKEPELHIIMKDKFPDYYRYFAPIEKIKNVTLATLNNKNLKTHKDKSKEYVRVTRRPIGDQQIEERIKELEKKLPGSVEEKKEEYYNHLEEGLSKLATETRIVHFNIRPENIIYDESQHCPIIKDFGEAFVLEDLHNEENMRNIFKEPLPEYAPIEAKLIASIVKQPKWKTRQVKKEDIENQMLEDFRNDSQYEKNEPSIMTDKWVRYIRNLKQGTGNTIVNKLLEHWDTWDKGSLQKIFETNRNHTPGQPY
jgi:hypothetical protein